MSYPGYFETRHFTKTIRWSRATTPSHHALNYRDGIEPSLWILWDSDPGSFGYDPNAVTNSAKNPKLGMLDLNQRMQESKSCVLPFHQCPLSCKVITGLPLHILFILGKPASTELLAHRTSCVNSIPWHSVSAQHSQSLISMI